MARYVKELAFTGSAESLFGEIHQRLTAAGYEYTTYAGEQLFKKGKGLLTAPQFLKVSFAPDRVRLEAWIKFAILPGVYAGEMDLSGFVGIAVKKPLQAVVTQVETLCVNAGCTPLQPSVAGSFATPAAPAAQAAPAATAGFCANCGARLNPGAQFCAGCGHPVGGDQ